MPSGHSTAAFAGFVYLALYLNAQLKLLSAHNPAYWKMLIFFAPILGAMLIAMSMVMDGFHHWYDVTVGGLIGTACAFVAYRQTFASIWDFRFNHVLLPRTTSLFMRKPLQGVGALTYGYRPGEAMQWPVTREGGWGDEKEVTSGAPFDATALGAPGAAVGSGGAGYASAGNTAATSGMRGNGYDTRHHHHHGDPEQTV
jgi:diacylglycerol diphosphate phosphatase / phosphatidate phosphatase